MPEALSSRDVLSMRQREILAEAECIVAATLVAEAPPQPRAAYVPLTDEEWHALSENWPAAAQGLYAPRGLLDAALEVNAFEVPWPHVYGAYGARQFFIRRARTGVVQRLTNAASVSAAISPERQAQFAAMLSAAEDFVARRR